MTGALWLAVLACVAISAGSLVLMMLRTARGRSQQQQTLRQALREVPPLVRIGLVPARVFEPLVHACLPARRIAQLERVLDSLQLRPALTPALWESTRLLHGLVLALLSGMPSGFHAGWSAAAALSGYLAGGFWLRQRSERQARAIGRELPAYLDLMTVCVEAGATLTAGIRLIVAQSPDGPLRRYFERVLREIRGGRPRALAFCHAAETYDVESLTTLAGALAHAEGSGMSLGQVLRTQAGQRTAERFARAERLAMQAPVKMLGPLILCIFPCTFIVIAVPIAVRLAQAFGT